MEDLEEDDKMAIMMTMKTVFDFLIGESNGYKAKNQIVG